MSKQQQGPSPQAAVAEKRPGGAQPQQGEAKAKPKSARSRSPSLWPWGPFIRIAASIAIVFHLTAVLAPPWAFQASKSEVPMVEPGGQPRDEYGRPLRPDQLAAANYPLQTATLPQLLANSVWHYANLLYLNNGYDFFTPDPGVSHLIRYEIFNDSGEKIASGQLPHRGEQWPRLFYHRHMMLVEQSGQPFGVAGWENHIADRLMEKYDGEAIRLRMFRHHLLTPEQVLAGQRIDSEATYEEIGVLERRRQRPAEITPGEDA
ncbi:MAG TPA: hypothetical protein VF175_11800 [Lacipirellula sp.]